METFVDLLRNGTGGQDQFSRLKSIKLCQKSLSRGDNVECLMLTNDNDAPTLNNINGIPTKNSGALKKSTKFKRVTSALNKFDNRHILFIRHDPNFSLKGTFPLIDVLDWQSDKS